MTLRRTRTIGYPDRRMVLAGMSGLAIAGPAKAEDSDSPVAHGVLANNALALAFEKTRSDFPDVTITGPTHDLTISDFKGKTILMPLWAEWCAPCLSEIPDFARLQQKYGNDNFAIVPVLTGTHKQMTPTIVADILVFLHAGIFAPLVEQHLGSRLMTTMARVGSHSEIPCNLLIAPDGTVIGRELGARRSADEEAAIEEGQKTADAKSDLIRRAEAGDVLSLWGKQDGEQFAAAMASGFLNQS